MKNLTTEARRYGEEWCDPRIEKTACTCHLERAEANATASRRTPIPPGDASAASRSFLDKLLMSWQIVLAALREIFDENAYDRFLLRTNALRSVASYREFLREQESGIARKPRCC